MSDGISKSWEDYYDYVAICKDKEVTPIEYYKGDWYTHYFNLVDSDG